MLALEVLYLLETMQLLISSAYLMAINLKLAPYTFHDRVYMASVLSSMIMS